LHQIVTISENTGSHFLHVKTTGTTTRIELWLGVMCAACCQFCSVNWM